MLNRHSKRFRAATASAVGLLALLVFVTATGAGPGTPASSSFLTFAHKGSARPSSFEVPARITALTRGDVSASRVLAGGLGRFESKLFAYPANNDRNICFGIQAKNMTDPAAVTCYTPTPDKHFDAMALEAVTAEGIGVQLYGVADDQVTSVRVQVDGQWRTVPLEANGLYLDLPGVHHEEVQLVEAGLKDGTTEVRNIQTGL
jgi:hypothetical protein